VWASHSKFTSQPVSKTRARVLKKTPGPQQTVHLSFQGTNPSADLTGSNFAATGRLRITIRDNIKHANLFPLFSSNTQFQSSYIACICYDRKEDLMCAGLPISDMYKGNSKFRVEESEFNPQLHMYDTVGTQGL